MNEEQEQILLDTLNEISETVLEIKDILKEALELEKPK